MRYNHKLDGIDDWSSHDIFCGGEEFLVWFCFIFIKAYYRIHCFPEQLIIEFHVFSLSNNASRLITIFLAMGLYILYAFKCSLTLRNMHFSPLSPCLFILESGRWTYIMHPKILKWSIVGLHPAHASSGIIFWTASVDSSLVRECYRWLPQAKNFLERFPLPTCSTPCLKLYSFSLSHAILLWCVGCCTLPSNSMHLKIIFKLFWVESSATIGSKSFNNSSNFFFNKGLEVF